MRQLNAGMSLRLCTRLMTMALNDPLFDKRPEQLGVAEFVRLTGMV